MRKRGCRKCTGHAQNHKDFEVDGTQIKGREAEIKLVLVYLRPDYKMPYIPTQAYSALHLKISEENKLYRKISNVHTEQ